MKIWTTSTLFIFITVFPTWILSCQTHFPAKYMHMSYTSTTFQVQETKFLEVDVWVPSICSLPPAQYCEISRHTLLHPGSKCKCPAPRLGSDRGWCKGEDLGNATCERKMTWNMEMTWCALPKKGFSILVCSGMLQSSANKQFAKLLHHQVVAIVGFKMI